MAYMDSETKAKLSPAIKAVCAKYGVKASLSVSHHSTLRLTISESSIDFLVNAHESAKKSGHLQVNTYWIKDHFEGVARDFLLEVRAAMMAGNHDRSDSMTDYFDIGWYVDINVGKWDKPYKLIGV